MSRPRVRGTFWGMVVIATAGVLAAYAQTVQFEFQYDDYHTVRPWSATELRQVLTGTWDPTKTEVAFYRPVTAWWYALRFELFGLNAVALRLVTTIGMIVAAVLVGVFVWRETDRRRAALVAAGLYAIHPALPYSQGAWLTNQMHLLATLAVLSGLLLWQRARSRSAWAWGPVFAVQIVAFGIKEDTLMLMPLVLTLGWVRFRFLGGVRPPGPIVLLAGLLLIAGLATARNALLGGLGGYSSVPTAERGWFNYKRGFDRVLRLVPPDRPWQPFASAFSTTVLFGGAAMGFLRRAGPGAYLLVAGLLTALFFNVPFVLVTKDEQVHLLALGAVIALTGGLEILIDSTRIRLLRWGIALVAVLGAMSMLAVTRQRAADFMPCSSRTLATDAIVTEWWVVPHEIKEWLVAKPAACRAGTLVPLSRSLTTATWAYGLENDERGRPFQWTSGSAVTFVNRRAIQLTMSLRGPTASTAHPIDIVVRGPAGVRRLTLTSGEWQSVTVPLEMTLGARLRGMHRIDLGVSPTFVPHALDPSNADARELGVQLRILNPNPR